MRPTLTLCLIALFALVPLALTSCFEERKEITLNADGTIQVDETLVISDRVLVASQEDGGNSSFDTELPSSEAGLRKQIEAAGGEILSLTSAERADGSLVIASRVRYPDVFAFMARERGSDATGSYLEQEEPGTVRWSFGMGGEKGEGQMSPGLNQFYGLAKGLYSERTVIFPAPVIDTNGEIANNGRSVTWVFDLRDRKGLEETRAKSNGEASYEAWATFPMKEGQFDLEKPEADQEEEAQAAIPAATSIADYTVQISEITWNKSAGQDNTPEQNRENSRIDMTLLVEWPEGQGPEAIYDPTLVRAADNLGNTLEEWGADWGGGPDREPVEDESEVRLDLRLDSPPLEAEALAALEGSIKVVLGTTRETVTLTSFHDLAGREQTGNKWLDEMGFRINEVRDSAIHIQVENGTIDEILNVEVLQDGEPIESGGGGGSDTQWTYSFWSEITEADTLKLEILKGEESATLPFSFEDIALP